MPSNALFNLSIIEKAFFKNIEIEAFLFNLLGKDYENPLPKIYSR